MSKTLRIGMVDLDTSHPESWLPIIRSMGHEVVSVFDGGTIYPQGYAYEFAQKHQIEHVSETLEQMIELVDLVIIHSCNWDVRLERALPFVNARKAILLDKPLAASRAELEQIIKWKQAGIKISGGSALRVCYEVQRWNQANVPMEEWVYGMVGCSVNEFDYGIHAFAFAHGLLGPGAEGARFIGKSSQRQIELQWKDGRKILLSVGKTNGYLPFYANVVTHTQVHQFVVDNSMLYEALLKTVLPYLSGEVEEDPFGGDSLIEVEALAIAAKYSELQNGALIKLDEIPVDFHGYDGTIFAESYKKLKLS